MAAFDAIQINGFQLPMIIVAMRVLGVEVQNSGGHPVKGVRTIAAGYVFK